MLIKYVEERTIDTIQIERKDHICLTLFFIISVFPLPVNLNSSHMISVFLRREKKFTIFCIIISYSNTPYTISSEEAVLLDFLVVLKHSLPNY